MEPNLVTTVGVIAAFTTAAAFALGLLLERSALGMMAVGLLTATACGLCFLGVYLGESVGLAVAIALVSLLSVGFGAALGKGRGAIFFPVLWLAFCASCGIGVWARGISGLLTITLPSLLIFWAATFVVSRYLLPLGHSALWGRSFRCLLGYCLGTNRPFHVSDGLDLELRVPGNPFGLFFAGPGLAITGPAQAPVIWTGLRFVRIAEPGLTFTERLETIYQTLDLRPQLRSFNVEGITRDGIRVRVRVHIAIKLAAEHEKPKIGTGFPFDRDSVYEAIWRQPVEDGKRRPWDEWVKIAATRQLRRILGRYRIDQLTETLNLAEKPRKTVQSDLLRRLRNQMGDCGIEIIDTWFENVKPVDRSVITERTEAWKAEWGRRILITEGKAQATALVEIEEARIRAQADLISAIGRVVEHEDSVDPEALANLAALKFIEALDEAVGNPRVREAVPQSTFETLDRVRRLVIGNRTGA